MSSLSAVSAMRECEVVPHEQLIKTLSVIGNRVERVPWKENINFNAIKS